MTNYLNEEEFIIEFTKIISDYREDIKPSISQFTINDLIDKMDLELESFDLDYDEIDKFDSVEFEKSVDRFIRKIKKTRFNYGLIPYDQITDIVFAQIPEELQGGFLEKFKAYGTRCFAVMPDEEGIEEHQQTFHKIVRHVNLAMVQKTNFVKLQVSELEEMRIIQDELERQYKELETKNKEIKSEHKKLLNEHHEMNEEHNKLAKDNENLLNKYNQIFMQFVAVLGIFAAIIFGAFGGIEILGSIMANIHEVRIPKLLMFSSLIISSILTILYLLLNGIANLTDSSIRSCGCKNNSECSHNVFKRHPIFMSGIFISLYLFTVGVIAQGFNTTDFKGISSVDKFMNQGYSLLFISVLGLLGIILLMVVLSRYSYSRTHKYIEINQTSKGKLYAVILLSNIIIYISFVVTLLII